MTKDLKDKGEKMTDIMVDIETLGNGKNAIPVQIGAVYFDRKTGEIGREFYENINARDAEKAGCEFDADTVYWWLSQSQEARESIMKGPRPIKEVMTDFHAFVDEKSAVWSHATFDFVIIQETFKMLNMKRLGYKQARDIRTLIDLAGIDSKSQKYVREGVHHDALADAKFQVKYCVDALNKLADK